MTAASTPYLKIMSPTPLTAYGNRPTVVSVENHNCSQPRNDRGSSVDRTSVGSIVIVGGQGFS
jgi:hypothetical protein